MENKSIYEQLDEIKTEINAIQNNPQTLQDKIDANDPKVFEFVKNAKRIWIYNGEKSKLKRNNEKQRKLTILKIFMLIISFGFQFLLISYPYGWICPAIATPTFAILIIEAIKNSKPKEYSVEYNKINQFGETAYLDDNDIFCERRTSNWLVATKIISIIVLYFGAVYSAFFCLERVWIPVVLFVCAFATQMIIQLSKIHFYYHLYFIDDKNKIEYYDLKDFMKRNKLK